MSDPFRSDLDAAHQRIEQLEAEHEKRVAELEEENRRLRARLIDESPKNAPRRATSPARVVLPSAMIVLGLSLAIGMVIARRNRPIAFDAPLPHPMQLSEPPGQGIVHELGGNAGEVEFDRSVAATALTGIRVQACATPNGPHGPGHVKVTFAPSGIAIKAQVDDPAYAGSAVGDCIAARYLDAKMPAFSGAPVTVGWSFVLVD
jgi:hypothetical protein